MGVRSFLAVADGFPPLPQGGCTMDYIRRIRDLREDADLTQSEVAAMLGTSQTMYARYERGANELPLRHLVKLCRIYHVSSDYILGLTDTCRELP